MTKQCKKCNVEKPVEEFVIHRQCKGGRAGSCKACEKSYRNNAGAQSHVAKQRKESKDKWRQNPQNKEKMAAHRKVYKQQPEVKAARREQERIHRLKASPEEALKSRARDALNYSIRYGYLVRKPCFICGSLPSDAHHKDYSKPLDVVFLCRNHHIVAHRHEISLEGVK